MALKSLATRVLETSQNVRRKVHRSRYDSQHRNVTYRGKNERKNIFSPSWRKQKYVPNRSESKKKFMRSTVCTHTLRWNGAMINEGTKENRSLRGPILFSFRREKRINRWAGGREAFANAIIIHRPSRDGYPRDGNEIFFFARTGYDSL